ALCSQQAAGLVAGGLRAMLHTKVKTATALLLAAGLVAGAAALTQRGTAGGGEAAPPAATGPQPTPAEGKPPAADGTESIVYGGRVLGPDGQPVAGAKLFLTLSWTYRPRPAPSSAQATTGPDGRFQFTVPKATFRDQLTVVAATAPNHGVAWVEVRPG